MRPIYKICTRAEWTEAVRAGSFRGSAVDRRDGYIHFSTAQQVAETATKYFAGLADLVLVLVDADLLGPGLKWESARGGALFPHLYGPLPVSATVWVKDLPLATGGAHVLPALET